MSYDREKGTDKMMIIFFAISFILCIILYNCSQGDVKREYTEKELQQMEEDFGPYFDDRSGSWR